MLKELKSREIISPPAVKNEDMKIVCIADNCTASFRTKNEVRRHIETEHRDSEIVDSKSKTGRRRGSNATLNELPEKKIKENDSRVNEKPIFKCQSQSPSQSEKSMESNTLVERKLIKFDENMKMSEASSIVLDAIDQMPSSSFPANSDPSQFCVICVSFERCGSPHCKISKQIISTWRHYNDGAEITKKNLLVILNKMITGYSKREEKAAN
ncbi:hypothetical protein CRE_28283 [Caenorhabditis remanei]|uniref:C2H2-type domain-containing protein n=2 Tax=Caenorhabditis remanei TaxID=31234 RepID=E3LN45_CAERE|nr:hypothetical protein CRE_28283 [Caenorhabditis remanei]